MSTVIAYILISLLNFKNKKRNAIKNTEYFSSIKLTDWLVCDPLGSVIHCWGNGNSCNDLQFVICHLIHLSICINNLKNIRIHYPYIELYKYVLRTLKIEILTPLPHNNDNRRKETNKTKGTAYGKSQTLEYKRLPKFAFKIYTGKLYMMMLHQRKTENKIINYELNYIYVKILSMQGQT